MIQKDYLMRLIEEMATVVARLFGLMTEDRLQEAIKLLDKAYDSFFKFEGKLLRYTPKEELLKILTENENMEAEQMEIISELLRNEAEVWIKMGKLDEGIDVLGKSIHLLEYLEKEQAHIYSIERKEKLKQSRNRWDDLHKS
ncbi:MAG: hypothetical protein AAFR87_15400 [Bacteroidota bacterium]